MKITSNEFARTLMGRKVRATRHVYGHHTLGYHERDETEPVVGWLVGFTHRRRGRTVRDYDGVPIFMSRGPSTLVFLVCPWPGQRTVDVAPTSIELLDDDYPIRNPSWTDVDREEMRKIMAEHPRGKDGRWVKA